MLGLTIIFLCLGHEGAVWCGIILSEFGLMITGAADGNFKIWKAGQCKNTIKAHSQAIRGKFPYFTHRTRLPQPHVLHNSHLFLF